MLAFSPSAPAFLSFSFSFFLFPPPPPSTLQQSDKGRGKHGSPLSFWGKAQHGDLPLPLTTRSVIINLCHLFSQFDNIQGFPCPLLKQSFRVSIFFFFLPRKETEIKTTAVRVFRLSVGFCFLVFFLWLVDFFFFSFKLVNFWTCCVCLCARAVQEALSVKGRGQERLVCCKNAPETQSISQKML